MGRRIVYVDMDGTLVDFASGVARVDADFAAPYLARGHPDEIPGVYSLMDPMPGAIDAFRELAERFDAYILSTAAWRNPSAWTDKLDWVKRAWGAGDDSPVFKRLILSHHKDLNRGDFLIDDNDVHGAAAHDVPTIFVTWGYGAPAETAGTVGVVDTADELRAALGL